MLAMTDPRPPLSIVRNLLLPETLATLLVAFYPSPIWRISGIIVFSYLCFTGLLSTTGDPFQDYSLGSGVAMEVAIIIALTCLINPIRDYRCEGDTVPANEKPWYQRIYWAFCLRRNPRGVGWNYQVSNIPASPTYQRWTFVRKYLWRSLYFFLLADVAETYLSYFPLLSQADSHSHPIPLSGQFLDGVGVMAVGTRFFAMMSMQHAILAVITVAFGVSEPRYWPKLFGHLADAYTLRRFWSRTWHQMIRQMVTLYGKFFTRLFGFRPGSKGSSFTQLYAAFILSGIVHCGGDLMVGRKYAGLSFPFFLYQAVAITLEDTIITFVKKSGIPVSGTLARLVGYSWVVLWLNLSSSWHLRWAVDAGVIRSVTLPFSLVKAVIHVLKSRSL